MNSTFEYNVIGKGHVERIGNHQYLILVKDAHEREFIFPAIDPYHAKQQAEDLCKAMRIHLKQFVIPPEVEKANIEDMETFLNDREEAKLRRTCWHFQTTENKQK